MRLPSREELFNRRGLRWLEPFSRQAHYWELSAEPVARGVALGVFMAMLPMPLQTVPAVIAAVLLRANIPVAAASVWVSNPLTWAPLYYFNYRVGAYITGRTPQEFNFTDMSNIFADLGNILLELWLGSLLVGTFVMLLTYLVTRVVKGLQQGSKRLPEGEQRQVDGEQQASDDPTDKTDH